MKQMDVSPADNLDRIRLEISKAKKGFRDKKYDGIQETFQTVIEMKNSADALNEFLVRNKIDVKRCKRIGNVKRGWITLAAFVFVFGEGPGRKYARAAEFLYDVRKVQADQIASELKKHWGISKVNAVAAKEDPRQKSRPAPKKADNEQPHKDKPPKNPSTNGPSEEVVGDANDELEDASNETASLRVQTNADYFSKLSKIAFGKSIPILITRIGGWGLRFEIEEVR
jgi:type IV secretory pathway VirB10-like protein